MIAVIMPIGIVKKNAIMMIDFALDAQRNQGDAATGEIHNVRPVRGSAPS